MKFEILNVEHEFAAYAIIFQNLKILKKRRFHADLQDVKFHSSLRKPSDHLVLCHFSSVPSDKFNYENCETRL